jgi:hypothetical protein
LVSFGATRSIEARRKQCSGGAHHLDSGAGEFFSELDAQ